eukprot:CAMPEP_0202498672 /NCGR_PEP_ID=MMETSP1361-20130828/27041_1 /ASSEMBLY_ACC=CAM_ASM_000849 /TAXON_ID=210615 /ORGANISM="Staurosira complex sp., Strain CCMP2646" /LENGTH=125 /DNA_ID=CAMNT_0049130653 /DNA_START=45 /DNA_END=422 /DNA_ORIENTATION=-
MSTRGAVVSGYRRLFRARKSLFQGDGHAMRESRIAIRNEFLKNKNVADGPHLQGLIGMIDEAEDMLRHGFARGDLNADTGRYEVKIKPEHMQGASELTVEPVTPEMADKVGKPPKVEVTRSQKDI